jgi:glucose-fructose oxidoreductase
MATRRRGPVRYAVVGLGHIAQVAVLPAFAHARRNSRLVALVSDDGAKRKVLSGRYRLDRTYSYPEGGRREDRPGPLRIG